MKKLKFQSVTGMHDILPDEQIYFQHVFNVCHTIADFYGFQKIDTPIVENMEIFSKGIGLSSDIVEKQMYALRPKGKNFLALRPEGTAPTVRAYIEHGLFNLSQPIKLSYFGPFFRYEHPQAGRFRQFWQFGAETFGEKSAIIDAQIIQLFFNILKEFRFKDLLIEINSIGDRQCKPYYKKSLLSYLRSKEMFLCDNCKKRFRENPLRVLDCKEEGCQRIKAQAPQMIDYLCEECRLHLKEVLEFLDELGLPYSLNSFLVRGLDYYTKTVFEIFTTTEAPVLDNQEINLEDGHNFGSKQQEKQSSQIKTNALVGGGRFDDLVKLFGGKDTPVCGGAMGIERVIDIIKNRSLKIAQPRLPSIFLAQLGTLAKQKSLMLFEDFRRAKIPIAELFSRDSLKSQLTRADKIGAKITLIIGQREALEGTVIIRDMKTGNQKKVKTEKIINIIKKQIKK